MGIKGCCIEPTHPCEDEGDGRFRPYQWLLVLNTYVTADTERRLCVPLLQTEPHPLHRGLMEARVMHSVILCVLTGIIEDETHKYISLG